MIYNPKIFKIYGKDLIVFNDMEHIFLIGDRISCRIAYKARILGVLRGCLIVLIKNKYIVSLDFSSFALNMVLYKGSIDAYTCSESTIWFLQQNMVYQIESDMQVTLYDDFTHTHLVEIEYLYDLATLAFFVTDGDKQKLLFESPVLPTLSFSDIASTPEIFFESKHSILLSIGRSVLEYDIQYKKLRVLKKLNPIKLRWNSMDIVLHYKIICTEIVITKERSNTHRINGDVWKIINIGNKIYLFSDSINSPICVSKIGTNAKFFRAYEQKHHQYAIAFEDNKNGVCSPVLKLLSQNNIPKREDSSAILFIHGGPHQKAGNSWDLFQRAFLQKKYPVYIPQYPGTFGIEGIDSSCDSSYGIDDFEDLILHYDEIKQTHQKIIIVGHSYGAFLGLKLFLKRKANILIGINGVYDLLTISSLNPKTYACLNRQKKISRSPKCPPSIFERRGEWHHIQFLNDPLVKCKDLEDSLKQVGGIGPKIHYLNFKGHGTFNSTQSLQFVELIKTIEYQYFNRLNKKSYEPRFC